MFLFRNTARETKSLLNKSNHAYNTEINDLFLTALAYTLYDWNKEYIQRITLEGHGREVLDDSYDVNKT